MIRTGITNITALKKNGPQGLKAAFLAALGSTAEEAREKVLPTRPSEPQRLKPISKQDSFRSAEALRHPKSGATSTFPASGEGVSFPR